MSDILAIKRMLESRAQSVAEYLLPKGRKEGAEWCAGSTMGEAGHSLKVRLSGSKAGRWSDFAEGGESGDLIDLWCAVRSKQLPEALDEIRGWLGLEKPKFERREKSYRRPDKPKCVVPRSAVREYMIQERKITASALAAYSIGEQDRTIVFPSLVDGELRFVKFLGVDRPQGKKVTRVEAGCEPILFGWQAIDRNAREVVITEGEIDALTMHDYGFPALSVPFGGGAGNKQQWIETEFERLQRFEVIYIATDLDDEGEVAAEEIAARLGRHRCRRVRLPHKDANACRVAGVDSATIRKCIEQAESLDPTELRRAGAFTDAVLALFWPQGEREIGYRLPFDKIRDRLVFRPAEMTIWTGPTGAGKSQILSHACVDWGAQGAKVCIASLEMKPARLLKRMVKQAGNVDRPTEPYIRALMEWMNEWAWIFDVVGKRPIVRILEVFEYARARYGCDVFVVDSLMRLGIGSEDYEAQEKAVFELVSWAGDKGVHLHLVAHARKAGRDGTEIPETEDIKGASEIGANAFNIISIWRNRKLENEIQQAHEAAKAGGEVGKAKLLELREKPPVILNLAKQRSGDFEGKIGLWFNQETYQYRSASDHSRGFQYLDYSTARAAE